MGEEEGKPIVRKICPGIEVGSVGSELRLVPGRIRETGELDEARRGGRVSDSSFPFLFVFLPLPVRS